MSRHAAAGPSADAENCRAPFGILLIVSCLLLTGCRAEKTEPVGTGEGSGQSSETAMEEIRRALSRGRFQAVLSAAGPLLQRQPDHAEALMHVAVAHAELGDFQAAIDSCRRVSPTSQSFYVNAMTMAGNLLLEGQGRVREAEQSFAMAYAADRGSAVARQRLIFVLSLQGKTFDALPLLLAELRDAPEDLQRLAAVVQYEFGYADPEVLAHLQQTDPECGGLWVAAAQKPLLRNEFAEAREQLQLALLKSPGLLDAHVRLGQVLLNVGTMDELRDWCETLPAGADRRPGSCLVLGQLAARAEHWDLAADCLLLAAELDATSSPVFYQLGTALAQLGQHSAADRCLERARLLQRYTKLLDDFATGSEPQPVREDQLHEGARLAADLQLPLEQYAWCEVARSQFPDASWARDMHRELPPLQELSVSARSAFQLEADFADRDRHSRRRWEDMRKQVLEILQAGVVPELTGSGGTPDAGVQLEDVASRAGLRFEFENGAAASLSGQQWAYDFTGGGIGVIDINADNWPDLFLSQGTVLDSRNPPSSHAAGDRILINEGGKQFRDVSESAVVTEHQYGQGPAVGDFDGDGFQDLMIGNIGRNRLLHNNGDGTFTDISAAMVSDTAEWTTSCVMADLNADGFSDLLAVNYLGGDYLTRLCRDETGRLASCAPQVFPGTVVQAFLNLQDGRFADLTAALGLDVPNGKGLGVIVAQLTDDPLPDIFIANDGVPNFLFVHQRDAAGAASGFTEAGLLHGVALNARGRTEACMGIAAEDLDGDGTLELFITNFYEESNTLYRRDLDSPFYSDQTWRTALDISSVQQLGFGTQAVDFNLDGWPDLMIANGHVDDFQDAGIPYAMQPQLYLNTGGLRFNELPAAEAGAYFEKRWLGRSVARLDWNHDGKDDLVVGHLKAAYALLENHSQVRGGSAGLRVCGTVSPREGFGTRVTVRNGSRTMHRQFSAGGGYLAANESQLTLSLPELDEAVTVDILWLSGVQLNANDLKAGTHYVAVEGRDVLYAIPD